MRDYWERVLQECLRKGDDDYDFAFTSCHPERKPVEKLMSCPKSQKQAVKNCYYLGMEYPDIYFTRREAECIVQLLKGKTISSTADTLGISSRTVEFYVKKMREKLSCNSKPALLEKISEIGFINKLDFI